MYIYSEKTKKRYNTVDECIEAEKEYDRIIAEETERAKKFEADRSAREQEIREATDKVNKLINAYIDDYGYLMTSSHGFYYPLSKKSSWVDFFF